jgi:hypothetical protein
MALVEEVLACLHRAPAGDRIDVEAGGTSSRRERHSRGFCRRVQSLVKEGDEFVGIVDVEAGLVVIEFDVVGEEAAEARSVAGAGEEKREEFGVARADLLGKGGCGGTATAEGGLGVAAGWAATAAAAARRKKGGMFWLLLCCLCNTAGGGVQRRGARGQLAVSLSRAPGYLSVFISRACSREP